MLNDCASFPSEHTQDVEDKQGTPWTETLINQGFGFLSSYRWRADSSSLLTLGQLLITPAFGASCGTHIHSSISHRTRNGEDNHTAAMESQQPEMSNGEQKEGCDYYNSNPFSVKQRASVSADHSAHTHILNRIILTPKVMRF